MIAERKLPKYFWDEAVSTTSYILNRALVRPALKKTPISYGKEDNLALDVLECSDANF